MAVAIFTLVVSLAPSGLVVISQVEASTCSSASSANVGGVTVNGASSFNDGGSCSTTSGSAGDGGALSVSTGGTESSCASFSAFQPFPSIEIISGGSDGVSCSTHVP